MTTKTTLSFTDRHYQFLIERVRQGAFASESAAVAAALEQMMRDEQDRDMALDTLSNEIHSRLQTPHADYVKADTAFAAARARLESSRKA